MFETFAVLRKYKYISLTPLTVYYLIRALTYIMGVQIKFMYQMQLKLVKFTKFMFCIQFQLFLRAQYLEERNNAISYLLPVYIYLLIIGPICLVLLFYWIFSRLCGLCYKTRREYTKRYLIGHTWLMTTFLVAITSTFLFIVYLGGKEEKDLQESMDGSIFT